MGKEGKKRPNRRTKHGAYSQLLKPSSFDLLDKRTSFGKAVSQLRQALVRDLGGTVSTQQSMLIDRAISKALRCSALEGQLLQGKETNLQFYISLSNSLRLDLLALGLERRQKEVKTLQDILYEETQED